MCALGANPSAYVENPQCKNKELSCIVVRVKMLRDRCTMYMYIKFGYLVVVVTYLGGV